MGHASRSWARQTALMVAVLAMLSALLPIAAAHAAGAPTTADGELFVVAVNAKQRDLDSARMDALVERLVNHTSHAPDVIFVSEIVKSNLVELSKRLNGAMDDGLAHYVTAGITTNSELTGPFSGSNIKVKILINSKTMDPATNVVWHDACTDTRTYQLITAQERLADGSLGRPVALAGVHFAPSFNEGGSVECKQKNAEEARRQMAEHADSGIMGDFNRRATTAYYECDPVAPGTESGELEPWYETMTGPSMVDGRSYRDTVRAAHWGTTAMPAQWSFEKETTETLCNGVNGYKRSRLDYIFVSDEMTPKSAGTDQGWGTGAPGDPACSTSGCKYSDHRFVWTRVQISTHSTTPARPTNLTVTPPAEEGRLDLTWTASDGAAAYDVQRYDAALGVRTWSKIATVDANAYSDQDAALLDGTTYHYRVVARDAAGHSRPSILASGTTIAPNKAPAVTITQPVSDSAVTAGSNNTATINVAATATDESPESIGWAWTVTSTDAATQGTFSSASSASTTATLPVGTHTLTATATDNGGLTHSAAVTVAVAPNAAPAVTITEPADNATVYADSSGNAQVPVAATATDDDAVTWEWTVASSAGTTGASFADPTAASTTATLPVGTHTLTATASDGSLHGSDTATVTVEAAPAYVDEVATSETAVSGTVSGTFAATTGDDGTEQTITEVGSGGKPSQRHNLLEHRWTFNVTGGAAVSLHADIATLGGEGMRFEYSVNGGGFSNAFMATATGPQSATLAGLGSGGTVVVRVVDTDRTSADTSADTIGIDHLYIRSDTTPPPAPAAPTGVMATAAQDTNSITVTWSNVDGETDYHVERTTTDPASTNTAPVWSPAGTVAADVVSFEDISLEWNTTYWYRVRAGNNGSHSDWSDPSGAATTTTQPATSIVLSATASRTKTAHIIDLTWTGSTLVDVYRDGTRIASAVSGSSYRDRISTRASSGAYTHYVCPAGTTTGCSNTTTTTVQ